MEILKRFIETAKSNPQRIVLPEGDEPRTLKAADKIIGDGIAKIILLGQSDKILALAKENGLKNIERATIIDPQKSADAERYTDLLFELRKNKGLTREQAVELVKDPLYFGCLMIKSGDADGELAGARNTTGNVLRPALQIVKTQPGISVISGAMLMFCKESIRRRRFLARGRRSGNAQPDSSGACSDSCLHRQDNEKYDRYRTESGYAQLLYQRLGTARIRRQSGRGYGNGSTDGTRTQNRRRVAGRRRTRTFGR